MNEGLEALERLIGNKVFISLGRTQGKKQFANDINIIEKELNRLNDLDMECNRLSAENQYLEMELENKEKQDTALEIIKEKNVWFWVFRRTHNVQEYNEKVAMYYTPCDSLTQEEYDLLKEAKNYGENA